MAEAFRLGIAGLGTVGAGVIKVVQKNASLLAARGGKPIAITAISSRNRGKDRGVDLGRLPRNLTCCGAATSV